MNSLWNKLWCVILSLAILVNLLPATVLASEAPVEPTVAQHWVEDPPEEATSKAMQPMEILSEDTSKRGEYYKEFVLNNGLRMASLYAKPVHYSEGGQWKEIDNTLKLSAGAYTNTAGQWQVSFPQQLSKDKAVTITKDGYTLSFFMAGALYRDTGSLTKAVGQEQSAQLQSFRTATAQLQAVKQPEPQVNTQYPLASVDKSHARLEYANVSAGTDIVYDLKGNQVKESIVMDTYSARLRGYQYTLNVGQLNPVLTDSGEIHLYDRDSKEIVMVMPAPFLVDDAGEYCYDVELTLSGNGSQYILTYLLPQQWLAASERQWPVALDPVVEADITRTNIRDVSVYEQNPPHNHNAGVLDVGHNTTYGIMRSFLKYRDLPALTSADVVVYAQLSLLKPNDNSTSNPIEVHKVLNTWESETMTLTASKIPEKITDKNGNTSYFDSRGRLYKLENNQQTKSSITITFRSDTDKRIETITDGAGRVYQFGYYNNFVNRISYLGSGGTEIAYTAINYNQSNPIKITDNDGKYSQFTYSDKHLLLTAQDIDGYQLTYTYTTQAAGRPSRVKTVTESHNGETGRTLKLDYAHNQTTFTETAPVSATETKTLGVLIKQFNNWGNTTAIQDDEGRAQFANYASNDPSDHNKGNQLLMASKLQNTVGNMLNNSSFEGTKVWGGSNITSSVCTTEAYLGSQSMKLVKNGTAATGYVITSGITAEAGATYTFSAYVKTGEGANAYLSIGSTSFNRSEVLSANQGWTRLQVSYTNTSSSNVTFYAKVLTDDEGPVYVDCVQLEKAETASRYNIIENGDFRFGANDWLMSEHCDSTEVPINLSAAPASELNRTAFRIIGDPSHKLRIR